MCFVLAFRCPTLHSAAEAGRRGCRFHTSEEGRRKRARMDCKHAGNVNTLLRPLSALIFHYRFTSSLTDFGLFLLNVSPFNREKPEAGLANTS